MDDSWINAAIARDIRQGMLEAARRYLAEYRRERMGFQRRMAAAFLLRAAEYRRMERNPQQRAA